MLDLVAGKTGRVERGEDTAHRSPRHDVRIDATLLECFQHASADWWKRRAVTFDRVGNERADEIAEACRNRASFIEMYGVEGAAEDLDLVLGELAA